jgi:hypothetical protein
MNDINNQSLNLIGDAYKNWCKQFEIDPNNFNGEELTKGHNDQCWGYPILDHVKPTSKEYKRGQINAYLEGKAEKPFFYLSQEEFINKIKTDDVFAKKWGVIVEVRELSLEERTQILVSRSDNKRDFYDRNSRLIIEEKLVLDESNIPTKAISLTYNNQTIENYE